MNRREMVHQEVRFKVLRLLAADPEMSQRQLADELNVSLGKMNYCLRALVDKGLIKVGNFRASADKRRYLYILTPSGLAEKAALTRQFLSRKIEEHDLLTAEIEQLKREAILASGQQTTAVVG